jgi:prolyl-tRNA synthetase
MKDGYSFHASKEDLVREFNVMEETYKRILNRLGLDFRAVEADSGAIGGSGSKEFMVLADNGEDDIVVCTKCTYGANVEAAKRAPKTTQVEAPEAKTAKFHTPGQNTIEAVRPILLHKSSD